MSPSTQLHKLPTALEFPANVIARASGAPPIPEVDQVLPDVALDDMPVIVAAPSPATAVIVSEERFAAEERRAERRMEILPLLMIACFCGSFYMVISIMPTLSVKGSAAALGAAMGYLAGTALLAAIGVGSVYAISMLFSCHLGSFASVGLRVIAIKTMIDVAMLAIAAPFGHMVGSVAAIPLGAVLLHWMFGFDRLQLTLALLINILARLWIIGAVMTAIMNDLY